MTDDMVEKAARALCALNFAKKGAEGEFGNVDDCWWAFIDEATAVIDALHVREMREALDVARRALVTVFCCDPKTSHAVLTIDAALALLNPQQEAPRP